MGNAWSRAVRRDVRWLRGLGLAALLALWIVAPATAAPEPEGGSPAEEAARLLREGKPVEALAAFDRLVEIDGESAEAHSGRAGALMALQRPTEALAAIDRAIAILPDRGDFHAARAMVLETLGRTAEAQATLEKALALAPEDPTVRCQWAFLLQRQGRVEEALKAYDRAIEIDSGLALAHASRAGLLFQMQRYEEAAAGFGRAAELQPRDAMLRFRHGMALSWSRRPQEALVALDRALELGAPAAQVQYHRSGVLNALGEFEETLRACDAAAAGLPPNARPFIMLTRAHAQVGLGRHEEALKSLEGAPTQGPSTTQVKILRVRAFVGLRRFDEAKSECDFCLLIYADNPFFHVLESEVFAACDGSPAALARFEKARKAFPDDLQIRQRHAQLLLGSGKVAEALAAIEECLRQSPGSHACIHVKADCLESLARTSDVRRCLEPWVERHPTCVRCRTGLAFAHALLGRFDEAKRILASAEIQSGWADYAHSVLHRLQGEWRPALEAARRNYERDPKRQALNYVRCLMAAGEKDRAREIAAKHSTEEPLPDGCLYHAYLRAVAGDAPGAARALAAYDRPWTTGLAFFRARIHGVLGQPDEVILWLGKAVDLGFRRPANAAPEPDFAAAAKDPRWAALEGRMRRAVEEKK